VSVTLQDHFDTSTVVVIDADADLRRYLACSMAALGASVYAVASAQAGLAKIATIDPDLVVFDGALEFAERDAILRLAHARGASGKAFVIALTDGEPETPTSVSPHVDEYLAKPIDHGRLLEIARRALSKRERGRRSSVPVRSSVVDASFQSTSPELSVSATIRTS